MPTRQAHATPVAKEAEFAQLVIAESCLEVWGKFLAKLLQAFLRALEGCIIAHTDKARVAGVIAVRNDQVRRAGPGDELVQQMVLPERVSKPDEVAIRIDEKAAQRIPQIPVF